MSDIGLTSSSQQIPVLDISRPFEALSDVSNDSSHNGRDCDSQDTASSERLSQPPPLFSSSTVLTTPSTGAPPGYTVLAGSQDTSPSCCNKSKKKSKKHKGKERSKDREKEKAQVKEKSRGDCELFPGNLKTNSIPHKGTGESMVQSNVISPSTQMFVHFIEFKSR